jgi:hypothetical protein
LRGLRDLKCTVTADGKKEYGKRITVAEAPFGNMKANKRWVQLSHRGRKKVKGECLLHGIGHNLGIICRSVSIDSIQSLSYVQCSSRYLAEAGHTPAFALTFSSDRRVDDVYGGTYHSFICQEIMIPDQCGVMAAICS